jgi:hypothetical protein
MMPVPEGEGRRECALNLKSDSIKMLGEAEVRVKGFDLEPKWEIGTAHYEERFLALLGMTGLYVWE